MHTVTQQIATFKKADRDRLAADLISPNGSPQLRYVISHGLKVMACVQANLNADDTMVHAESWRDLAISLRSRGEVACANYADALAVLLTKWACEMTPAFVPAEWSGVGA